MKLIRKAGATSNIFQVFVRDSSSLTGGGLTGLAYNTSSLTAYYHRDTDTTATAISLVTMTVGTFTSGGFKEIDATNMPGWYQICPPDAAIASGAKTCAFHLKGATNMAPLPFEVQLVAYDPDDAGRLGLTDLPNGPMMVKKDQALSGFTFPMYNSSGALTTGLTVSGQTSLNGGAFSNLTNSVSEIADGWYTVNLAAADVNGNVVALRFAASGAVDTVITVITQP